MRLVTLLLPTALALTGCATAPSAYWPPDVVPHGRGLDQLRESSSIADREAVLSAQALGDLAVLSNPDLKAMRARAGVAEAQVFAAGLLPDPTVSFGADAPLTGANELVALAASIGIDLASLSSRGARLDAAIASSETIHQDIVWAEWLTRQNAQLLSGRIAWLETIKSKTGSFRQLAEQDLARSVAAAARGDIAAIEVDARRLAAADAADRDRSAESQLAAARLDLNRLLGISPDENVPVQTPSPMSSYDPQPDLLYADAIKLRADLDGLRAGLGGANDSISVAEASRFPLPGISLNAGRDSGNLKTLGPAVSFTLPVWNRAQGDIAVARADLSALEAEYLARTETVRADIGAAASAFVIARRQHLDVATELGGIAQQADRAEAAALRGDISQTSAAAIRLAALDKDILADTLSLAAFEAFVALETETGKPLETSE